MDRKLSCFAIAASLLLGGELAADVIYKSTGGKVVGTIIEEESDASVVAIKSRAGVYKIPRSEIEKIDFEAESAEDYKEEAKKYKDTAEDQYALALWCLEQRFRPEYEKHLARVIELDPDHAAARKRLGHRQLDGVWMTEDEFYESQGYVKYKGKYVLPQAKQQSEDARANKKAVTEYFRKIKLYQRWLNQDREDRAKEAEKELLAIDDPVAVRPLFEILGMKGEAGDRRILVEVLAKIESPESTQGLLNIALDDTDETNRAGAIEQLLERKTPKLVEQAAKALRDNDNATVNNAGTLLAAFGDDSVVTVLIDALVTEHRYVRHLSQSEKLDFALSGLSYKPVTTYFGPDGVMYRRHNVDQFTPPPGVINPPDKLVRVETKQNMEVLRALETLTEQDFGFDKNKWKSWLRTNYRSKAARTGN